MSALERLQAKRSQIAVLCRKYGVTRLRVFGSALSHEWSDRDSDFDFLADFGSPPAGVNLFTQQFSLIADLEDLLGRSVDLVDTAYTKRKGFLSSAEAASVELYAA